MNKTILLHNPRCKKSREAMNFLTLKKIDFEIVEPKKRKVVKKSYADNFLR